MSVPDTSPTDAAAAFRRLALHPLKMRWFMLRSLPMAYLAGLRVRHLTPDQARVTVPFTYLTKNPFRSIYFACLSMAAELATGLLAMQYTRDGTPVSMLIVGMEAEFHKKAVGLITFTCSDGPQIAQTIAEARATGSGHTAQCTSTGVDQAGDTVAVFRFTWSFRAKQ